MSEFNWETDTFSIISKYFDENKDFLTKHHLDSYYDFVNNKIMTIFKQYNPYILPITEEDSNKNITNYKLEIFYGDDSFGENEADKIYISKPLKNDGSPLYPNEARLKNITYSASIHCDIGIKLTLSTSPDDEQIYTKVLNNIKLGEIPIMVKSKYCILANKQECVLNEMGECPYDQGGYFIINGKEKVIVSQEKMAENMLYVLKSNNDKYLCQADIKAFSEKSFRTPLTTSVKIKSSDNTIVVFIPHVHQPIPLFIVFRALGIISDKEIIEFILYDLNNDVANRFLDFLRPSVVVAKGIQTQKMAFEYIKKFTRWENKFHTLSILRKEFLAQIDELFINKAYFLGHMVNKLLYVNEGFDEQTDKDSYVNKRIELSGSLMAELFRELYRDFQNDTRRATEKLYEYNKSAYSNSNFMNIFNDPDNINNIFNKNIIHQGMINGFRGKWGKKKRPQ